MLRDFEKSGQLLFRVCLERTLILTHDLEAYSALKIKVRRSPKHQYLSIRHHVAHSNNIHIYRRMSPILFALWLWDVLAAVSINSTVFWVVTPCSLKGAVHFGGTYRLHLRPEDGSGMFLRNVVLPQNYKPLHPSRQGFRELKIENAASWFLHIVIT
jgi:hypothetical protein